MASLRGFYCELDRVMMKKVKNTQKHTKTQFNIAKTAHWHTDHTDHTDHTH
uniref:Uncharacterized protein n=1 Tax=viral metagenome TaxID=1070528 RepID=A0A6C0HLI8_9ZZZZ